MTEIEELQDRMQKMFVDYNRQIKYWKDRSDIIKEANERSLTKLENNIKQLELIVIESIRDTREIRDILFKEKEREELLEKDIEAAYIDTSMSYRVFNACKDNKIKTVGDLVNKTPSELLSIKDFGPKSLKNVVQVLDHLGLELKND